MKVHYDAATDALYLRLADAAVTDSEEIRPGVVLDYDEHDHVVAVEILHVRRNFPDADVNSLRVESST